MKQYLQMAKCSLCLLAGCFGPDRLRGLRVQGKCQDLLVGLQLPAGLGVTGYPRAGGGGSRWGEDIWAEWGIWIDS